MVVATSAIRKILSLITNPSIFYRSSITQILKNQPYVVNDSKLKNNNKIWLCPQLSLFIYLYYVCLSKQKPINNVFANPKLKCSMVKIMNSSCLYVLESGQVFWSWPIQLLCTSLMENVLVLHQPPKLSNLELVNAKISAIRHCIDDDAEFVVGGLDWFRLKTKGVTSSVQILIVGCV